IYFLFFFSSRRRHTRFSRDWSSDVCSSDLVEEIRENDEFINVDVETRTPGNGCDVAERETQPFHIVVLDDSDAPVNFNQSTVKRSEERRVGKERRTRRGTCETKNNEVETRV